MSDDIRERIAALRPWPEGEKLIQSLERLADRVLVTDKGATAGSPAADGRWTGTPQP